MNGWEKRENALVRLVWFAEHSALREHKPLVRYIASSFIKVDLCGEQLLEISDCYSHNACSHLMLCCNDEKYYFWERDYDRKIWACCSKCLRPIRHPGYTCAKHGEDDVPDRVKYPHVDTFEDPLYTLPKLNFN